MGLNGTYSVDEGGDVSGDGGVMWMEIDLFPFPHCNLHPHHPTISTHIATFIHTTRPFKPTSLSPFTSLYPFTYLFPFPHCNLHPHHPTISTHIATFIHTTRPFKPTWRCEWRWWGDVDGDCNVEMEINM